MTYFSKLFRYNKKLCLLVAAFCALTVVANLMKVEITPVFIWGMYSEKEPEINEYRVFKIIVNDSIAIDYSSNYPAATRFYLLSPILYSWRTYENKGIDPEESYFREKLGACFGILEPIKKYLFNDSRQQPAFLKWYRDYLEEVTQIKIEKLELKVLTLVYVDRDQLEIRHESTFAQWKKP